MRKVLTIFAVALWCAAGAAAQEGGRRAEVALAAAPAPAPESDAPPRLARERVVLRTNMGDLVLALYPEVAPEHTAQILRLVRAGVYDGLDFFRVEPNFVAQLSDARRRSPALTDEERSLIRGLMPETGRVRHERGSLSMARHADRPDSGETSFSILFRDAPHLDGTYTVFGRLESGYEVLDAIGRVARGASNRPVRPVVVRRAEVVESPEALAALSLRGSDYTEQYPPLFVTLSRVWWAFGVAVAAGLCLFFFSTGGRGASWVGPVGLLLVLVGFFGLLVAFTPNVRARSWASVLLFAGVVALFKLMNRFESGRRAARAAS
jgi:cyclophilin family peptidyl-prolyl cis-trans isomerase